MNSRITRRTRNQLISGVCSGLSEFYGINVNFLRALWAITIFGYGFGFALYVIMTMFLPEDNS